MPVPSLPSPTPVSMQTSTADSSSWPPKDIVGTVIGILLVILAVVNLVIIARSQGRREAQYIGPPRRHKRIVRWLLAVNRFIDWCLVGLGRQDWAVRLPNPAIALPMDPAFNERPPNSAVAQLMGPILNQPHPNPVAAPAAQPGNQILNLVFAQDMHQVIVQPQASPQRDSVHQTRAITEDLSPRPTTSKTPSNAARSGVPALSHTRPSGTADAYTDLQPVQTSSALGPSGVHTSADPPTSTSSTPSNIVEASSSSPPKLPSSLAAINEDHTDEPDPHAPDLNPAFLGQEDRRPLLHRHHSLSAVDTTTARKKSLKGHRRHRSLDSKSLKSMASITSIKSG